jgi:Sulfotransferase family
VNEAFDLQNGNQTRCKYVFVCGLPRSGTSLLGRNIARMENCTGLHNTGVFEDEGRFLQDVYPTEDVCGGPGRFGFDPRAHLTETSPLLTDENVAKLRASWHPYWDHSKTIFVEKTPANLLMTRFLQAAFPNSYFIVIKRHPISVGMAAQKWKVNVTSLCNMFEHWLHCHGLYEQDKKYLKHVYQLRYEDYIENPVKYHQEIAGFIGTRVSEPPRQDGFRYVAQWRNPLGLRVPEGTMEAVTGAHNQKYFNRWSDLLSKSLLRRYYRYIAVKYEPKFTEYGYSLTKGFGVNAEWLREAERISATTGALYCVIADTYALFVRSLIQTKGYIKRQLRAHLPEPLKIRIKRVLRKMAL